MIFLIVPHNQDAIEKNDYGIADHNIMTIISFKEREIPGLWENGYFNELNTTLNLMIDTAEEETIAGRDNLKKALEITNNYIKINKENKYLLLFRKLLQEEIEKNTLLNICL